MIHGTRGNSRELLTSTSHSTPRPILIFTKFWVWATNELVNVWKVSVRIRAMCFGYGLWYYKNQLLRPAGNDIARGGGILSAECLLVINSFNCDKIRSTTCI